MWKATDDIFSKFGRVTPRVGSRATLKRINTAELLATQRDAVAAAFDYIIKKA
jgi:chromosome partitioning protein